MTVSFIHETLGQRVLFGRGQMSEYVRAEVERMGATRVMLIASTRDEALAIALSRQLPVVLRWSDVRQHVPIENAERARAAAHEAGADVLVSVGGGSTTGLAKAVALTSGVPIIAVPTTYSGSEATDMWGSTEDGAKRTGVDPRVLPVSVVYDCELSLTLPVDLSVASGLNALAHCVDSLWAPRADPINQAMALEGARALSLALKAIIADPQDVAARDQALYGCYLSAVAFASAGSGLHHKICHVLGGSFSLPHAETHATVLPYVLALNAPAVPELAARLAAAIDGPWVASPASPASPEGSVAAVTALNTLRQALSAPRRLADYGFTAADVPDAAERVLAVAPPSNPVPVTMQNITRLLTDAQNGAVPASPHTPATAPAQP